MKKYLPWLFCLSLIVCGCGPLTTDPNAIVPDVTPVVAPEFRCLILEESADRPKLTQNQLSILIGKKVDTYMKQYCVKDVHGNPEFRIYDKDTKLTGPWAEVIQKNPPQSFPWFYCTNGTKGTNGPVPKSGADKFIEILNPFSGAK